MIVLYHHRAHLSTGKPVVFCLRPHKRYDIVDSVFGINFNATLVFLYTRKFFRFELFYTLEQGGFVMKKILLIVFMLFFPTLSLADNIYWVDNNGTASWSNAENDTPLSGSSCCSLSTANSNASAGDMVYLRAGTYEITASAISPANSGSAGNPITFSGYGSETVTIHGASDVTGYACKGIYLYEKDYIKVTKINFTNMYLGLRIHGGGHHEISYCNFSFRYPWADLFLSGTAKSRFSH